jgi:predicted  nucleic acid-binding Zn-ribbon protein
MSRSEQTLANAADKTLTLALEALHHARQIGDTLRAELAEETVNHILDRYEELHREQR